MGRARPPFVEETREKHTEKQIEVWFQDEARFGQQGTLTSLWADRGRDGPLTGCIRDLDGDEETDQAQLGIMLGYHGVGLQARARCTSVPATATRRVGLSRPMTP